MPNLDLNKYQLPCDARDYSGSMEDYSTTSSDKKIEVYFRDIASHLIKEIEKAEIVVGCVAWLTNPEILKALSKKKAVSIIVQKEDFLRPDFGQNKKGLNRKKLRLLYSKLNGGLDRLEFENVLQNVSICTDPSIEAVRCVGHKRKFPGSPLMHNKFLVFCRWVNEVQRIDEFDNEISEQVPARIAPYAVWTGSFNLSKTASLSFENAVLIRDFRIARAYYNEYGQICTLSEPLDWESEWVAPTWRIGT